MVKLISISEEAYLLLKRKKKKGMSFSDVIIKEIGRGENKKPFKDFILFLKSLKKAKRRTKISIEHDKLLYGRDGRT